KLLLAQAIRPKVTKTADGLHVIHGMQARLPSTGKRIRTGPFNKRGSNRMKSVFMGASILALSSALAGQAMAQDAAAAADGGGEVETIIVTGTRAQGIRAVDSPAPVQVLDATSLTRGARPDLAQALAASIPSYVAQSTGGDLANLTLSAKLRGVSPNHA